MIFRALADLVVLVHLLFVVFVIAGGFLAIRRPALVWVHLPCAAWGAIVEFGGWICPLTPLENWLREAGAAPAYAGGFVDHYLLPLLYPAALTRSTQLLLGSLVVAVNAAAYALLARRWAVSRRRRRSSG